MLSLTNVAVLSFFQKCVVIRLTRERYSQILMMAAGPFDFLRTTATELERVINSGAETGTQLVEVYLAEIDKHNGYLKAVIATTTEIFQMDKAKTLGKKRADLNSSISPP